MLVPGALALLSLLPPAPQSPNLAEVHRMVPRERDDTHAIATGDVNGDGAPDLFLALQGRSRLLRNTGTGRLVDASSALPDGEHSTRAVALFDLDGDGDLDLLFGNGAFDQGVRVHLGNGAGRFTEVAGALADVFTSSVRMTRIACS
jgi:hypothetical protein